MERDAGTDRVRRRGIRREDAYEDAYADADTCIANYPRLPRKEVIQPHLPVRLPCYDFTPVTDPTLDSCAQSKDWFAHRLQVLSAPMV
jgi:hypothetical protein